MEDIMMGVALREEARFRNRIHDDWERDYVRMQRLTDRIELVDRIKDWVARLVAAFRGPSHGARVVEA